MSERPGFTVSPAMYVDQFGVEHVSFEHAHVVDHGKRQEIQAEALDDQASYFSQDSEGNIEHDFDIGELGSDAWVDSIHDGDDDDEDYEDDDDDFDVSESIFDDLIDEDSYETLISWAADNLSEATIDAFDDIIEDGSYEDIYNAISQLIETYNENNVYY